MGVESNSTERDRVFLRFGTKGEKLDTGKPTDIELSVSPRSASP